MLFALYAACGVPIDPVQGQSVPSAPAGEAPQDRGGATGERPRNEIIVTGKRLGDADIASREEFDEEAIAADGAETIGELLAHLNPAIAPTGRQPVILINGKPTGHDGSILSYPVEALRRVAVLKLEAGSRYGAAAGTPVVNLVLKPRFTSLELEGAGNAATAGGQYGGSMDAGQTGIRGNLRWNAQARIDRQGALRRSARPIPASPGAAPAGPLVDDNGRAFDPDDFETLQPSSRTIGLNLNVARPLGTISASLTVNALRTSSSGLSGIPWITLAVPAGSPWSPDGTAVTVQRAFDGTRALRNGNSAESLGATLSLTGRIRGVQADLTTSLSNSTSSNRIETGIDVAGLQALLDGGQVFDPRGPIDISFLQASRSRSRSTNANVRLNLQKAFLKLPAGEISWSAGASMSSAHSVVAQASNASSQSSRFAQTMSAQQLALLGNLDADLSFNRQSMTGSGSALSYGGALNWVPVGAVEIRGTLDRAQIIPSSDQLSGPLLTTINRVFDYSRLETVEVAWTVGGNPALRRGRQTGLSLTMAVRPLARRDLSLSLGYRKSSARNASTTFPELTPEIEAAFPERVVRSDAGTLISVDARSINVARQDDAVLTSGISLRLGARRGGGPVTRASLAANPLQTNLALSYDLQLESRSLIRPGLPEIDWLADSGAARHSLTFRLNTGKRAFGSSLNATWKSASFITSADQRLRRATPIVFDLSSFLNLEHLAAGKEKGWAKGLKLSLDVHNVLNAYPRVTFPDGTMPQGYSRNELDPLGRTVRIALRKQL
jgi:hypothetical protein